MEDQEEIKQPQYYAGHDVELNRLAFYVDEIHGDNIPDTAIPITEEEWQTYAAETWKYKVDDGIIREKTQQELDEEAANRPPAPPSLDNRVDTLETESVNTMIGLIEVYETTAIKDAERETENINTMVALTEVYELVSLQQATIDALTARLEALEGSED